MRPMPGQDFAPLLDKIRALAKEREVHVDIYDGLAPLHTPVESRIVQEALSVTNKSEPKTVAYGTDGMIFGKTMELVVLGPGNIQQAHTIDEWIEIEQLHQAIDTFSEMVRRFCV